MRQSEYMQIRLVNSALTVGEDTLPVKTMVKDLGATVDCNFKYNEHVKI